MNDDIDPLDLAMKNSLKRALEHLEAFADFCANPPPDIWDDTSDRFRIMAIAKMFAAVILDSPNTNTETQTKLLWLTNELHKLIPERHESLKQHDGDMSYWLNYINELTKDAK